MSTRTVKKRPLRKTAVGDMRDRIGLYQRDITAPVFGESQASETYVLLLSRWCKVESLYGVGAGEKLFDDIDVGEQPNVKFTIRYTNVITKETRILWRDEYYEIKKTINPEQRNEYLELYSKILGDESKEANE